MAIYLPCSTMLCFHHIRYSQCVSCLLQFFSYFTNPASQQNHKEKRIPKTWRKTWRKDPELPYVVGEWSNNEFIDYFSQDWFHFLRLVVDIKFPIHIHIHRFSVDIHGYIHPKTPSLRTCSPQFLQNTTVQERLPPSPPKNMTQIFPTLNC